MGASGGMDTGGRGGGDRGGPWGGRGDGGDRGAQGDAGYGRGSPGKFQIMLLVDGCSIRPHTNSRITNLGFLNVQYKHQYSLSLLQIFAKKILPFNRPADRIISHT